MRPIPQAPIANNDRSPSREEVGVAIVDETVKILKGRGSFDELALRRYLSDIFIALPDDEVTSEEVHDTAECIADEFALWQAGGLQS